MRQHWPRWFFASVSKHFDALRQGLPMYVEGTDRDTATLRDFIEFRMDGPRIRERGGVTRVDVIVNILVQSTMDSRDDHRILKSEGIVLAAFTPTINVFRYGDGSDDDQSLLLCLKERDDIDVRINRFGIVDETVRKMQSTIEGHYRAYITGS